MDIQTRQLECGLKVVETIFDDGSVEETVVLAKGERQFLAMAEDFDGLQDAVVAMKSVMRFFCGDAADYNSDLQFFAGYKSTITLVKPEYLFPEWGC